MKIIYLHQYFTTPRMAGGTRSYELATRLVGLGHEVHMITSDRSSGDKQTSPWRETEEGGIRVHWTAVSYRNEMSPVKRIAAFVTFGLRAMRKASELKGDVIFATSSPLTIAIPAIWASYRNRIPMVFEIRDLWPAVPIAMGVIRNPLARWAALRLERMAYERAERVVALAPGMKDHVVSKGIPDENVSIIPNGADVELFSAHPESENLREKLRWLDHRPLVVYCGAIGQVNGVDYLAHVAAEVAKIDSEIRFAVIGSGRLEPQVRDTASSLGILNKNFFLMGELVKEQAATWVRTADMTIALITGPEILWRHATQNKFFDSLAAGKPVANNFTGWQSEIAVEEEAGLILDSDDYSMAAKQLVAKLADPDWMKRASANAAALGRTRFNRDAHAKQLAAVLNDALRDYRQRRSGQAA